MPNEPGLGGETSSGGSQQAVFLSYASEDADAAQRICAALRAAGIEVWVDQSELRGGDAWDGAIRKQIKACALFMPVISANTRARVEGYFRLEWKLAVDRSHLIAAERAFLVPIVIDDTREADALVPDKFREVQWTRLPGGETPPAFVERVARLLADERPAPQRGAEGGVAGAGANRSRRHRPACRGAVAAEEARVAVGRGGRLIAVGFAVDRFVASGRSARTTAASAVQSVLPPRARSRKSPSRCCRFST